LFVTPSLGFLLPVEILFQTSLLFTSKPFDFAYSNAASTAEEYVLW
jgi:hypothetical protein